MAPVDFRHGSTLDPVGPGHVCEENVLSLAGHFFDNTTSGQPLPDGLRQVEAHLSVCAQCKAMYQRLAGRMEGLRFTT